jgi:hypothetical protein
MKLTKAQIDMYQMDEEGRSYLEYNDKVGGDPLGLVVPYGYPDGVDDLGGVIGVYQECIKQHKTWKDLLGCPSYEVKEVFE